jgi:DNA-binding SARP family transcriptional activator
MEFRVLGPLEVRRGGESVALGGAKQRALLALLVLNANRVVPRDHLVDELWGEEPPDTAVATVQVYVSRLRKLLGSETLVTRPGGYLLQVPSGRVDAEQFERLRAEGRPAEALALWRGPPLAELSEPFARAEAARLDDLRLATLEERIESDIEHGEHAEVVGELQALIAEHPHRERLRRQLMLALYGSERQAEALQAYRDARATLDELGIQPSEELRRLERSILQQDATLAAGTVLSTAPILPSPLASRAASPFVGRARELSSLNCLMKLASDGNGQVALLGGEAGSGKSRVLRELAHVAVKQGVLVLYGSCDPIVDAPYQPFLEALEFLLELSDRRALAQVLGSGRDELARLLPELGDPPAEAIGNAEVARRVLHSAVRALVTHVSRERPLLLMLDDMHWADGPSLELFRDLSQSTPQIRLLLLGTYRNRSEDMRPEFSDALAALARIDGIARLKLGGLSGEEVAEFVRSSSGAAGGEVATAIHELTEGTPFFLCELWRELVETQAVEKAGHDLQQLARPLEALASPQGVRDLTRYRLSRLALATREMLDLAATMGPTFELMVIERAGGSSGLAAPLEEALATGTIEELRASALSYRFSHELVRRAVYDRLSGLRRAELHLRVGDALEHVHGDAVERILPELARHFTIAVPVGGRERAIEYNVRAAEAAVSVFAMTEAENFAAAALEHADEDSLAWARAKYVLATAGYRQGKWGAQAHGAAAAAAFAALGDPEAAAAAEIVAVRALLNQSRGDEAEAALDRALALVRDRPPSSAKALALLLRSAILSLSRARFSEALECARDALELADQLGVVSLQVAALIRIGTALGYLGTEGMAELERAVELSRGGADPDETRTLYINLATRLLGDGRVSDSYRVNAEGLAEAEHYGLVDAGQWCRAMLGSTSFLLGEWRRAEAWFREYRSLGDERHTDRVAWMTFYNAAQIALGRGEDAAALAEADASVCAARGVKLLYALGRSLATLGRVHVEQGRRAEAEPIMDELSTLVDESGLALRWRGFIDYAWLIHDLGRPEMPPVVPYPVWSDPAQAIARGDLAMAAELLAASELKTDAAYARLRAAEQLAAEGRQAEAHKHAERAAEFYRLVGATAYLCRAEALAPTYAQEA